MIDLSEKNWEKEVTEASLPVLVDFWGPNCGPCQALSPILKEVSHSYHGKLKVGSINANSNMRLARQYGIRALPTLMLFRGSNVVGTRVGSMSKKDVLTFIKQVV